MASRTAAVRTKSQGQLLAVHCRRRVRTERQRCMSKLPSNVQGRRWNRNRPQHANCSVVEIVKGCRTPARARDDASIRTGLRAGVGQASREETAAHAAVPFYGAVVMAIRNAPLGCDCRRRSRTTGQGWCWRGRERRWRMSARRVERGAGASSDTGRSAAHPVADRAMLASACRLKCGGVHRAQSCGGARSDRA